MSVTQAEIEAIRGWAASVPIVKRVWIFGSRAKGTARADSDLDVAVEHDSLPGDSDAFTTAIGERGKWRKQLQPRLSVRLDLQSQIPGMTPTIQAGLDECSQLVYERHAKQEPGQVLPFA